VRVHWPPHPVCQNTVAVPTRECAAHRWAKSVLDLFCSRSVLYVGPKWNPVPDVRSLGSVQACIGTCKVVHCGPGLHLCISFCGDMEGFFFYVCAFVSLRLLA